MNGIVSRSSSARGGVQAALLGGLALVMTILVVTPLLVPAALYYSLRPSGDLDALCGAVSQSTGLEFGREFELSLSPMACTLVRAGTAWAGLPPEAQSAFRAIRAVEVGVYGVSLRATAAGSRCALVEIDEAMSKRGWERIVGVMNRREVVAVFAPRAIPSRRDLSLAVLVFDGSRVVVASVRGDPEALVELALQHAGHDRIDRLALRH